LEDRESTIQLGSTTKGLNQQTRRIPSPQNFDEKENNAINFTGKDTFSAHQTKKLSEPKAPHIEEEIIHSAGEDTEVAPKGKIKISKRGEDSGSGGETSQFQNEMEFQQDYDDEVRYISNQTETGSRRNKPTIIRKNKDSVNNVHSEPPKTKPTTLNKYLVKGNQQEGDEERLGNNEFSVPQQVPTKRAKNNNNNNNYNHNNNKRPLQYYGTAAELSHPLSGGEDSEEGENEYGEEEVVEALALGQGIPAQATNAVVEPGRGGRRMRMRPLQYWRNEHVVYGRRGSSVGLVGAHALPESPATFARSRRTMNKRQLSEQYPPLPIVTGKKGLSGSKITVRKEVAKPKGLVERPWNGRGAKYFSAFSTLQGEPGWAGSYSWNSGTLLLTPNTRHLGHASWLIQREVDQPTTTNSLATEPLPPSALKQPKKKSTKKSKRHNQQVEEEEEEEEEGVEEEEDSFLHKKKKKQMKNRMSNNDETEGDENEEYGVVPNASELLKTFYVLQGFVMLELGEEKYQFGPGGEFWVPPNFDYVIWNCSSNDLAKLKYFQVY
jgi:hypothetical protein